MSRVKWLWARLSKQLWLRVVLFALGGVAAAIMASLSGVFWPGLAPIDISVSAIDSLLTIIASSMLAVTTFSVGALTAAYSSSTGNGTARARQLLTQDGVVQNALGTFVGSFLFSIVALIALKVSAYGPEGRAVLFVVTILVVCFIVVALLRWINQLTSLGSVADTLSRIEAEAKSAMEARLGLPFLGGAILWPNEPSRGDQASGKIVESQAVGYVNFIETAALSELAESAGLSIDILVLPGTFVYSGTPLARLRGSEASPSDPGDWAPTLRDAFAISALRSYEQDPRFGLVVLSEVALRALSPAVNDPGTAIDVIGRQARLLTYWGEGWEDSITRLPQYPRLRVPPLLYNDMFEDAFNLIGRDGAGQIDVLLRLTKSLRALTQTGSVASRSAAARQLEVVISRAEAALTTPDDLRRLREVVGR